MTHKFEILYNEGSDSVVIGDSATHDDVAEIFHNERHTVNQTVEQALETARLFAAAPELAEALRWLRAFWVPGSNHDTQEVQHALAAADAALTRLHHSEAA